MYLSTLSADECTFQYTKQPPGQTIDACNPYDQSNVIKIEMECIVRTPKILNGTFKIRWFRVNTTGEMVDLGIGHPVFYFTYRDYLFITSRYHNTKFFSQQYNTSFLGKYWCQVINTTADPDQPLMRSNVFTLLPPECYSGTTCTSRVQFTQEMTCADPHKTDIAQSKTITTTKISTTTLQCLSTQSFLSGQ